MSSWFWTGIITSIVANELCGISEWIARKLVRISANLRYEEPERARIRAEELSRLIADRPGQLFKLITAMCFLTSALRAYIVRLDVRPTFVHVTASGAAITRISVVSASIIGSGVIAVGLYIVSVSPVSVPRVAASGPASYLADGGSGDLPRYKPSSLSLGPVGGSVMLTEVRWSSWSSTSAVGIGTMVSNDCRPDCAAGNFSYYPVRITAFNPRTQCKHRFFQVIKFKWLGAIPADAAEETSMDLMQFC